MKNEDRRLHIAVAIACAFTAMWVAGVDQQGTAFRGPEGTPTPLLSQIAEGVNQPASLIQRAIRVMPAINDEFPGPIVFFGAATLLWLWLFAWIPYLRGRRSLPLAGVKVSIVWCAVAGGACFYRLTDVDAMRTFPSLISSAGFENAVVASSVLLWLLTLLWGSFLVGSALASVVRVMKALIISDVNDEEEQRRQERKAARLEHKQKRADRHKAASRRE